MWITGSRFWNSEFNLSRFFKLNYSELSSLYIDFVPFTARDLWEIQLFSAWPFKIGRLLFSLENVAKVSFLIDFFFFFNLYRIHCILFHTFKTSRNLKFVRKWNHFFSQRSVGLNPILESVLLNRWPIVSVSRIGEKSLETAMLPSC